MVGCIIVTYFCLPETKGRSAAELDEMFEAKIPARKFKDYVSALAVENFSIDIKSRAQDVETVEEIGAKSA